MKTSNTRPTSNWLETLKKDVAQFNWKEFQEQLKILLKMQGKGIDPFKMIVFIIGAIFTFVSFTGMIYGYIRAYNRFMRPKEEAPRLDNLPFIVKFSMVLGGLCIWIALYGGLYVIYKVFGTLFLFDPHMIALLLGYLAFNLAVSYVVFLKFRNWRTSIYNYMLDRGKFASAQYMSADQMNEHTGKKGFYMGGNLTYADKGHYLLVGGTRSGKGTNLIIPNLLGVGGNESSFVVIDPKGENCSICSNYLKLHGYKIVTINPWDILSGFITQKSNYNPLMILFDKTSKDLVDDVMLIASLIIPTSDDDHNKFFSLSAKNVLAGYLLHLVTTNKVEKPTLTVLFEWLRYSGEAFDNLLADMATSTDPVNGHAVRNSAHEILKMMGSEETFASIVAHILEATNFMKSSSLQAAMESEFDPSTIADQKTAVFIVIGVDKLTSHAAWLRLVVTSIMRACVRKPSKRRITFIVDECAALGRVTEFEQALAVYAGFNISMWLIYQDLAQLHAQYGDKWESIIANCYIRQFSGIKDNFTAKYVSDLMGETSNITYSTSWLGTITASEPNFRMLATPDEVIRMSSTNIITFIGENPVTIIPKNPYYKRADLNPGGVPVYDLNPYMQDELV